jgi:hypothetical protein
VSARLQKTCAVASLQSKYTPPIFCGFSMR